MVCQYRIQRPSGRDIFKPDGNVGKLNRLALSVEPGSDSGVEHEVDSRLARQSLNNTRQWRIIENYQGHYLFIGRFTSDFFVRAGCFLPCRFIFHDGRFFSDGRFFRLFTRCVVFDNLNDIGNRGCGFSFNP